MNHIDNEVTSESQKLNEAWENWYHASQPVPSLKKDPLEASGYFKDSIVSASQASVWADMLYTDRELDKIERGIAPSLFKQRDFRIEESIDSQESVQKEQAVQKQKRKEFAEEQQKIQEANKVISTTSTLDTALKIATLGGGVLLLVASFFGAGVFAAGIVAGVASIAQGVNLGVQAYHKHELNQFRSKTEKIQHEKDVSHQKITDHSGSIKTLNEKMSHYIKSLKEITDRAREKTNFFSRR